MAQTTVQHPDGTTLISFAVPTTALPDVIDALCDRGDFTSQKNNFLRLNPGGTFMTRPEFAKSIIVDFVKTVFKHYKGEAAGTAARATAEATVEAVPIA